MKLDLNKQFVKSPNAVIPDITISMALAMNLMQAQKGNSIKFYHWAVKLEQGEILDIDQSDKKLLYDFVDSLQASTIIKAQMLMAIEECK